MITTDNLKVIKKLSPEQILEDGKTPYRAPWLKHLVKDYYNAMQTQQIATAGFSGGLTTGITPEGQSLPLKDIVFSKAQFNPKRFGEAYEVSEQFEIDTDAPVVSYLQDVALRKIHNGIRNEILIFGYDDNDPTAEDDEKIHFEKMLHLNNAQASTQTGQALSFNDVFEAYQSLKDSRKLGKDSFWLINSDAKFSVLDDLNEERLVFTDVPEGAMATLLGMPVYQDSIHDTDGNSTTAFALIGEDHYHVSMSDLIVSKPKEQSTAQALKGTNVVQFEIWADGKFVDNDSRRAYQFAPTV